MYFPIGWPKSVNLALPGESKTIKHICFDAVKILLAAVGSDVLGIWYANPLVPIVFHNRNVESVVSHGENKLVVWKPDSRQLIVLTTGGTLILYQVDFDTSGNGIFMQMDSPFASLKRDSAELFIKENIPKIGVREVCIVHLNSLVTAVCCISLSELLVATRKCELLRMHWSDLEAAYLEGTTPVASVINLHQIQFYVNQHCNLKTIPPVSPDSYVAAMEYSPFIGGCAAVFSDKRAAFVIANHLKFETASMHAFWIPEVVDATACSVNHKFRIISFGRSNSDVSLYAIEDTTGGLEFSHTLSLNSNVMPGTLGSVCELKWSPDGCVLAVAWENGGIALWSTFGSLLMSSFSWDFGIHVDLINENPLCISKMEWSTEGYQLYLTRNLNKYDDAAVPRPYSSVYQINFVKSALTMNPCMTAHPHVLLQGDDTLYLNQGDNLEKNYFGDKFVFPNKKSKGHPRPPDVNQLDDCLEIEKSLNISSILAESKYWTVLQLPQTYMSTNWPIRYSAIDASGIHLAVAGRTGLAHYSMLTRRWKLFGNESQEKDFVISGGLMWWKGFIVCGCYSLLDRTDEIRCYPEECKLDNEYGNRIQVRAPVISLNIFRNQMIALTADGFVTLFALHKCDAYKLRADCIYEVDVKSICIHPACIVSLTVTNLRNDLTTKAPMPSENGDTAETIIVNVCGRILMIQRNNCSDVGNSLMASCLASCVEVFWLSNTSLADSPMRDCLWLFSGIHGMRVWLPILPPSTEQRKDLSHRMHTFMSKRIMLSFPLKLYPLAILFDNVIVLGVENETAIYTSEPSSHFALPYSQLERKSQVYLHKILRQLIKRNLGYSAWEIAQSCRRLPYFPHSLELLLHEVLEEEATSKDPIPDALLPSILDFIREFPVYLQTIVQCARKTEIALWPYLFSMAGKPKDLFQQCLESEELVTAASYLIILQNLEPSVISKQYATILLEVSLQHKNWELAKDLIRFLKAIDPNEIDSPRSSMVVNVKIAPPNQSQAQVNQNPEAFNLVLGPIGRERSFSTTVIASNTAKEKKEKLSLTPAATATGNEALPSSNSGPIVLLRRKSDRNNLTKNDRRETFCIELILQKHARKLLQNCKLIELGHMSAYLDFHLVAWLSQEAEKSALLDDYVTSLCQIHKELNLQSPCSPQYHLEVDSEQNFHQLQNKLNNEQLLNMPQISSQTSESGYYSLTLLDTPTSTNNANVTLNHNIPSIYENEEVKYSSKATVSVHDHPVQQQTIGDDCFKSRHYIQTSLDRAVYKPIYTTMEEISASSIGFGINCGVTYPKILPEKISIKIRYLLQLFIEANCIDMALVLSILLQDASSIGRIINVLTRSENLTTCVRIQNLLKRFAIWSFDVVCVYRSFMISLQPYIYFLDQFVQSSSTPMPPVSISKLNALGNVQNNRMENSDPNDFIQSTDNMDDSEQSINFEHDSEINRKWSHENYNNEEKRKNSLRPLNSDSTFSSNTHPSFHQSFIKQSLPPGENINESGCNIM